MFPYRYKISLRFWHPTADLSRWTQLVGITPNRQWTAGESRTSPSGTPLGGERPDSYWSGTVEIGELDIEDSLLEVVASLEKYRDAFESHSASGGSAELFIGYFLEAVNGGFALKPELLGRCASLGLALDLDIYGQEDEPSN